MIKKYLFYLVLSIGTFSFSQGLERKTLIGKVIADSLEVENLTVYNLSSKTGVITDIKGNFSIKARPLDTLYIQGLAYESKHYILAEKDFWVSVLEIKLHIKITELNEVVVTPFTLTGNLKEDTKKIVVYGDKFTNIDTKKVVHYEDNVRKGTPTNSAMPNVFAPSGISLMPILSGFATLVGIKGNPKNYAEGVYEKRRIQSLQAKSYSEHLMERFSKHFFIETLQLKEEEIPGFMGFSELSVYDLSPLLKAENELQLIQYLLVKADAYKREKEK